MTDKNRFTTHRLTCEEAINELLELSNYSATNISKFSPLRPLVDDLKRGESLILELNTNDAHNLRQYLSRRYGNAITLKTRKVQTNNHKAFIFLTTDLKP